MEDEDKDEQPSSGLSRRDFLKVGGISLSVPLVVGYRVVNVAGAEVKVYGPGKVPITLTVNGKLLKTELRQRFHGHLALDGAA